MLVETLRGIKLRTVTTMEPSAAGELYSKFPGFSKGDKSTEHDCPGDDELGHVKVDEDPARVGDLVASQG